MRLLFITDTRLGNESQAGWTELGTKVPSMIFDNLVVEVVGIFGWSAASEVTASVGNDTSSIECDGRQQALCLRSSRNTRIEHRYGWCDYFPTTSLSSSRVRRQPCVCWWESFG